MKQQIQLIALLVLFLLPLTEVVAQDIPFDKANFKEQKDGLKAALKSIKIGDQMWEDSEARFEAGMGTRFDQYVNSPLKLAIPFYLEAQAFNPNNSMLNFKLGKSYLYSIEKEKALDYLLKARELNANVDRHFHYYLGYAYHLAYDFDKAKYEYEMYRKSLDKTKDADMVFWVTKKLGECTVGKKLMTTPERVWIDNLGPKINTSDPEYSAFIRTDESLIIYTSRREDSYGDDRDPSDQKYFEDIYFAEGDNGVWEPAANIGENINTESHDASAGISPDGNTLYVYNGSKNGGDIFVSRFEDGEWTKLESVGKNINTKMRESSACLSYDGKQLYFVSEREGGLGGRDLWTSSWNEEKEEWALPTNMGATINTKYDEEGVFIHPDGKTMYFSSNGRATMGGYDIFVTVLENGQWSEPRNLGYPINTPDNDVFFVVSANGRYGYMSSIRKDGIGDLDLYKVTFLGPEKEPLLATEDNLLAGIAKPIKEKTIEPKVLVSTTRLAVLKGVIRDEQTKEPLRASIDLIDNTANKVLATFESDSKSGKYLVTLPAGKNYGIAVRAEGYLFHSENFNIPDEAGYKEYERNVDLKKIEVGKSIVLRNIFFDHAKYSLRNESINELNRLLKLMQENPTLRIEISGHTDSDGTDAYNETLSGNRASSVVKWLTDNGIAASRMESAGYGEKQPIATNKTEEGKQLNRRTEFKIISL